MASTKTGKTTKGSRKPNPKYLGLKLSGGQTAATGAIIIRQHGSRVHAGPGTNQGRDCTIYAMCDGVVNFYVRKGKRFVSVAQTA